MPGAQNILLRVLAGAQTRSYRILFVKFKTLSKHKQLFVHKTRLSSITTDERQCYSN